MTLELLVKMIERALGKSTGEVVSFTPSVVGGRRYVGLKFDDGKEFLIQIDEV